MAYCTLADIRKFIANKTLIKLTDEVNQRVVIQGDIDAAITMADSEIDGWLNKRYTVPFDPVPELIKTFSIHLAIYYLYLNSTEKMPGTRKMLYEQIASGSKQKPGKLKMIADGDMDIPGITVPGTLVFSRMTVDHFVTDSDALTNQEI